MRRRTCFTQAVALLYGDVEPLVHGGDEILRQGRRAGVHHAEGGEVVVCDGGVFAEEEDDGGDDVGECYLGALDRGAEFLDVESGHYYQGKAAVEGLVD